MATPLSSSQDALRHYLVSLAYRFSHVVGDAPADFANFEAGHGVRTPSQLVRHLSGLIQFVHEQLEAGVREKLEPLPWKDEYARFLASVQALDSALAKGMETRGKISLERLWQGPLVDAMTHVGQLATLRRLAGSPIEGVAYWQVAMPPVASY